MMKTCARRNCGVSARDEVGEQWVVHRISQKVPENPTCPLIHHAPGAPAAMAKHAHRHHLENQICHIQDFRRYHSNIWHKIQNPGIGAYNSSPIHILFKKKNHVTQNSLFISNFFCKYWKFNFNQKLFAFQWFGIF